MRKLSKLLTLLLICLLITQTACIHTYAANTTKLKINGQYMQDNARSMFDVVNSFRKSNTWYWNSDNKTKTYVSGLSALTYDYELERVAMQRAAEIAISYDHTRPNGEKFSTINVYGNTKSENITITRENDMNKAFDMWKEEKENYDGQGHRRIMLMKKLKSVGIGHFYYNGLHFWVQEFSSDVINTKKTTVSTSPVNVTVEVLTSNIRNLKLKSDITKYTIENKQGVSLPKASLWFNTPDTWSDTDLIPAVAENVQYKVENTSIANIKDGKIYGLKNGNTNLKITASGKSVTIPVTVQLTVLGYSDLKETSGWRYDAIKYVKENNIMTGDGKDRFMPDDNLTRAMFATILYRVDGSQKIAYKSIFSDVKNNDYYSIPVTWAYNNKVITGYAGSNKFGTYDNIKRQDLVTMLYRYANFKKYNTSARADLSKFADESGVESYAKEAMQWAVANGIITGKNNKWLDASGNATRVEAAAMIMRFMKKY